MPSPLLTSERSTLLYRRIFAILQILGLAQPNSNKQQSVPQSTVGRKVGRIKNSLCRGCYVGLPTFVPPLEPFAVSNPNQLQHTEASDVQKAPKIFSSFSALPRAKRSATFQARLSWSRCNCLYYILL